MISMKGYLTVGDSSACCIQDLFFGLKYLYALSSYNSFVPSCSLQFKSSCLGIYAVDKKFVCFTHYHFFVCLCADYLELALQFGIVVMFASFFPLVAVLALLVSRLHHLPSYFLNLFLH